MTWLMKLVIPVVLIGGAVAGFQYLKNTAPSPKSSEVPERVWAIAVAPVATTTVRPRIRAYGEVVAGRVVDLRPAVSGRVLSIAESMVEGGTVKTGAELVVTDPFAYQTAVKEATARLAEVGARIRELKAQASAEEKLLESTERELALARRDLARRQDLLRRRVGSQSAVDQAETTVVQARQALLARAQTTARLRAQIDQQAAVQDRLEAALEQARRNLRDTRLKANIDGFIADLAVGVGQEVGPSDRLARLIDADRLEVSFQLPDAAFGRLVEDKDAFVPVGTKDDAPADGVIGRPVRVRWRLGDRVLDFTAAIERVAPRISAATGGVELRARILDAGTDRPLRPGAFVEVQVPDVAYRDVVVLPRRAVDADGTVYRVVGDRLEADRVRVLRLLGDKVLVEAELAEGTRIVATRFPEIGPGVRVDVRETVE